MISERELLSAIDECNREPFSFAKLEKLSVLFTVHDHLYPEPNGYSAASAPVSVEQPQESTGKVTLTSGSDFAALVDGKPEKKVWAIVADAMDTLKTLHPKAYDGIRDRLKKI